MSAEIQNSLYAIAFQSNNGITLEHNTLKQCLDLYIDSGPRTAIYPTDLHIIGQHFIKLAQLLIEEAQENPDA